MAVRVVRLKSPQTRGRAKTATGGRAFRVCVAEQNRLAAQYLFQILAKDRSFEVVRLEDMIVHKFGQRRAVVFVVDRGGIDLPLGECLQLFKKSCPQARFVVLDREQPQEDIVQLLTLGIHGLVAYDHVREQLREAIISAAQGKMWISADVLEAYVRHSTRGTSGPPAGQEITHRENQVVELVKRRLSNKEIAAILNIQESTVKFHLSNIFSKLQVNRRSQLQDKGYMREAWRRLVDSEGAENVTDPPGKRE